MHRSPRPHVQRFVRFGSWVPGLVCLASVAAIAACTEPSRRGDSPSTTTDATPAPIAEIIVPSPAVDAGPLPADATPPDASAAAAPPTPSGAKATRSSLPACPVNQILLYGPGCDPPPKPRCSPVPPPMFDPHCGCDGRVYGMASAPWRNRGPCTGHEGDLPY